MSGGGRTLSADDSCCEDETRTEEEKEAMHSHKIQQPSPDRWGKTTKVVGFSKSSCKAPNKI